MTGTMDGYQWFINGIKYPTRDVLTVKLGERVETPHWHPEEVPSENWGSDCMPFFLFGHA